MIASDERQPVAVAEWLECLTVMRRPPTKRPLQKLKKM